MVSMEGGFEKEVMPALCSKSDQFHGLAKKETELLSQCTFCP